MISKSKKELILKGSYKGTKKIEKMKNFDIIKSIVNKKIYKQNKLNIKKIKSTITKKKSIYIYHSYDSSKIKGGRWYNIDLFTLGKYSLNNKKYIFNYVIPEYEIQYPKYKVIKNMKVEIYFTEKGWDKFVSFINYDKK